jgi:hypothetical protein
MENISWMEEDIVECIYTITFLSTSNVGMAGFVDPHIRMVLEGMHFKFLEMLKMKVFQK